MGISPQSQGMAGLSPLWVWAAVVLVAAVSEESFEGSPALKWKDMSQLDRKMASKQADNGMNHRTRSFARQQQSDDGIFALDTLDSGKALQQSKRPALDQAAQREAGYLSSDLSLKPEALNESPQAMDRTRRKAVARAREIEMKTQALREGGRELGESGSPHRRTAVAASFEHLVTALTDVNELARADSSSTHDLGEDVTIPRRKSVTINPDSKKNRKIESLKAKVRVAMKELTEKHMLSAERDKTEYKAAVRKANLQRSQTESTARTLVPQAEALVKDRKRFRKQAAESAYTTASDKAQQRLRTQEAKIIEEKQQLSLDAESKETEIRSRSDKVSAEEKQNYLVKMSEADRVKALRLKLLALRLKALQDQSAKNARLRFDDAVKGEKETIELANLMKKQAFHLHREELEKADTQMKEAQNDMGEAKDVTYKEFVASHERKKKGIGRKLPEPERKKQLASEGQAIIQVSASERKKQLAWIDQAERTAMKSCNGAKKEEILKSVSRHLSVSRLSRFLTDKSETEGHQRDEAQRKSKKLNDSKEKASKHFEDVVKKAAVEMAADGKVKSPQVDSLENAAVGYESTKLPADTATGKYKSKSEDATKADVLASKHSAAWASEKSLAAANRIKEDADITCDDQQRWFQREREKVRKRLGMSTEKGGKAVEKGEFQEGRWANLQTKILMSKGQYMTEESVEDQMKLSSETRAKSGLRLKESISVQDQRVLQARQLKDKAKRELALVSLRGGKAQDMELLNAKGGGHDAQLRKVRTKIHALKREAQVQEDQTVAAAEMKADENTRRAHQEAAIQLEEVKSRLGEVRSEADKRLLQDRLEAAQNHVEAKKMLAEAEVSRDGSLIAKAQEQRKESMLDAKDEYERMMKDAKAKFETKIESETGVAINDIKKAKTVFKVVKRNIEELKRDTH